MITIGKPFIYEENEKSYLKAAVKVSEDTANKYAGLKKQMGKIHWRVSKENYPPEEWKDKNFGLWFSVDKSYAQYLCDETADAFVVALIWYAMATGSDIVSESPVSEKLLFSINNYLVPALCTEKNGFRRVKVNAPCHKKIFEEASGVGTGMSCGVDSLYTIHKYGDIDSPERKLTHLTYLNAGSIFRLGDKKKKNLPIKEFYAEQEKIAEKKFIQATNAAKEVNLPVIYINTNLDQDFYRGAYGYTAVYRNCACTLALQKLFRTYYSSSGGAPFYHALNIFEASEAYESLLCNSLSTESCTFVLSDYISRIEKTQDIADLEIAHKYLDVCYNFNNCGHCIKCYRTLIVLDFLDKLDYFKPCFDIEAYKKNRVKAYAWLLLAKSGDPQGSETIFAKDIYRLGQIHNKKIPATAYLYMWKKRLSNNFSKCKKKVLHLFK